jgi:iron complex outermembrane recepter protein
MKLFVTLLQNFPSGKVQTKKLLFFLLFLSISTSIFGQTELFQLSGKVTSTDGEELVGAAVFIHELNRGTTTNIDGYYQINNIKRGVYHLHITYLGYASTDKTIRINQDVELNFILHPTMLELKEIFVEAFPFKSGPIEQSLSVEIVDKSFLDKNAGNTLVNSLEKLPGVSAINTGVGVAKPVIRGMSFNRIMVKEQGIKQEGQQWGADHGLEIDQYNVERVEVLKGPGSLIYGSDAMGGVMNIEPAPLPDRGVIRGGTYGVYKSNNDLYGTSTMAEGNINDHILRLRVSTQDFADYKVPAENFTYNSQILPIHDNRLKNTAGRERNLYALAGVKKNWGYSTLSFSSFNQNIGMFPGAVGVPRSYSLQPDDDIRNIDLPRQVIRHNKVISNTNIQIKQHWLEVDLGYQHNDRREESLPHVHGVGPTPSGNLALGLNLHTYTANARLHLQEGEKLKGIYGFNLQHQQNHKSGFEFLLPDFSSYTAGLFTYQEYRLNHEVFLNGGIRYDIGHHNIQEHLQPVYLDRVSISSYDQRNPDIVRTFYNVSGATGVSYLPMHNLNLKLNLGSSFRFPTPMELASNGIHHGYFRHERGRSDLKSERGYHLDITGSFNTKSFHINASPFFNYFHNYIYLQPSRHFSPLPGGGQLWEFTQTDAHLMGFEVAADWHILKNLHCNLATEYVRNYNYLSGRPLPLTPPFSVLGELEYKIDKIGNTLGDLFFRVSGQSFAAQNRVERNERRTPGYFILNAGLGTKINLYHQPIEVIVSLQNLTDTWYMNHMSRYRLLNLPEQGRNIHCSLRIPFEYRLQTK